MIIAQEEIGRVKNLPKPNINLLIKTISNNAKPKTKNLGFTVSNALQGSTSSLIHSSVSAFVVYINFFASLLDK